MLFWRPGRVLAIVESFYAAISYPHGRDARERVPTIAVGRDLHLFPYLDAHGRPREVIISG